MTKILEELAKEATKSFWREVGEAFVRKAVETVVVESIKMNIDIWRRLKLKREFRELDKQFRAEDTASKAARSAAMSASKGGDKKASESAEDDPREAEDTAASKRSEQESLGYSSGVRPNNPTSKAALSFLTTERSLKMWQ
ncbi:MAG: hypothetical protein AAGI01_14170 [Myxococcota bacterium]